MKSDSFKDYILEQLNDVPTLSCQRMFGNYGLYFSSKFFGIIADGKLYFRTTDINRNDYLKYGMKPFQPREKQTLKNYYEVPADIIEDRHQLKNWIQKAII